MSFLAPIDFDADIAAVSGISAVPRILDVICRSTGMGFAAVARVTESRWVCCSVRDDIGFGLKPGGELQIETTICNEIRQSGRAVVIDNVAADPGFSVHPTPAMYGFQSYISVPIRRADGSFWGTLCAIDPRPARLNVPEVTGMFDLYAELVAFHLDASERLEASEAALVGARQSAQLREEFIAVLGHDLRNPLQTINMSLAVVERDPSRAASTVGVMRRSVQRVAELLDNLTDFARGRLGGGMAMAVRPEQDLTHTLRHVVDEAAAASPGHAIAFQARIGEPIWCEPPRIAQLLSNLLGNALKHGAPDEPIEVEARTEGGQFWLAVSNGGPDIPEPVRLRLFEPYFRANTERHEAGLGLGLYIVAEIARAHGGAMDVLSEGGRTRFTLRMPCSPARGS